MAGTPAAAKTTRSSRNRVSRPGRYGEIAAAVKAAYPDLSALVYRYPNEARGRLKKAGTPVPPAREV